MKKETLILILVMVFLILAFVGFFSFSKLKATTLTVQDPGIVHVQEMPVSFKVTDKNIIGITTDNDSLKFGTMMRGLTKERDVTIVNPFNMSIKVFIDFTGDAADYISIPEDSFILQAEGNKKFTVTVTVPEDAKEGNYTGMMKVSMSKNF